MSGAAVKAVYPALSQDEVRALDRRFLDYSAFRLEVQDAVPSVDGGRATVNCLLVSEITMRNGSARRSTTPAVITLEARGEIWTIASVSRLP
jgi:hypothetical protein